MVGYRESFKSAEQIDKLSRLAGNRWPRSTIIQQPVIKYHRISNHN